VSYSGFPTGPLFQLFIFLFGCALEELLLYFYRCRRTHMSARALCFVVCVCVWSSRFVNYIGPNQTCYTHTDTYTHIHIFIRFLILHCFFYFLLLYIFFTYTHAYIYIYIYIYSFALLRTSFVQTPTSIRISFYFPPP